MLQLLSEMVETHASACLSTTLREGGKNKRLLVDRTMKSMSAQEFNPPTTKIVIWQHGQEQQRRGPEHEFKRKKNGRASKARIVFAEAGGETAVRDCRKRIRTRTDMCIDICREKNFTPTVCPP